MSNVVLQFGGCGNRLGRAFFDVIARDIAAGEGPPDASLLADDRFFVEQDRLAYANAVLLGTESTVLNRVQRWDEASGRLWRYFEARVAAYPAPGDNFGAGYNDHTGESLSAIMDVVRQQTECCPRLEGLLAFLSLAGGTGTGLGSRVVKAFKDDYPRCPIIATAVWPFSSGESTLQVYNTVLGLSHLQQDADAVLLLANASLLEIAEKRQRPRRATLDDMNTAGGRQLACLLRPSQDCKISMGDMTGELKCGNLMKYLSLLHAPWVTTSYDSYNWKGLAKFLRRSHQTAGPRGKPIRCLAALTLARGENVRSLDPMDIKLDNVQFQSTWRSARRFLAQDKTLMLASNGHACLPLLAQAARDASRLYGAKAYMHIYRSHGVEDDAIKDAIGSIKGALRDYVQTCPLEEPTQAGGDTPRRGLRGRPSSIVQRSRRPSRT